MFFYTDNVWKDSEAQISKKLSYLLKVFRKAYFEVGFMKNLNIFEPQIYMPIKKEHVIVCR